MLFKGHDRRLADGVKTDEATAQLFLNTFVSAIELALKDPRTVRAVLECHREHAPGFPETLFCKGCLIPVLDTVATAFLGREFGSSQAEVNAALRCEGFSTLPKIYTPSTGQSGYSTFTWGTNYQPVSKSGKPARDGSPGYLPCPDFGVVHETPKFAILGETKFSASKTWLNPKNVAEDLKYYLALPSDPARGWHYDFGVGIVYAGGGEGMRKCQLITEYWSSHRFIVACFFE